MSADATDTPRAGYALAYREAMRGLEDQERSAVELRTRAGALIAAAAIATSFLGWVAIGCFVLLGVVVLVMLWPRRDWAFSLAPEDFIAMYLEPSDGEPLELHLIERDLALHMGRSIEFNRDQLNALVTVFRVGALLLVTEMLAWVVALAAVR
jgi:hypothetical protein